MTITLHLSPRAEARLLEQAAASGKQPEELALSALEAQFAAAPNVSENVTPQEWVAGFRRWAESHRRLPIEVDDSRDSIYAGCGE